MSCSQNENRVEIIIILLIRQLMLDGVDHSKATNLKKNLLQKKRQKKLATV